jgi:hypothetical protein
MATWTEPVTVKKKPNDPLAWWEEDSGPLVAQVAPASPQEPGPLVAQKPPTDQMVTTGGQTLAQNPLIDLNTQQGPMRGQPQPTTQPTTGTTTQPVQNTQPVAAKPFDAMVPKPATATAATSVTPGLFSNTAPGIGDEYAKTLQESLSGKIYDPMAAGTKEAMARAEANKRAAVSNQIAGAGLTNQGIGKQYAAGTENELSRNRYDTMIGIEQARANTRQAALGEARAYGTAEQSTRLTQQQFEEERRQAGVSEEQWNKSFEEARRQAGVSESQWQKEYDQGLIKFNTETQQWERAFTEQQKQANIAQEQWNKQFDEARRQAGVSEEQWNKSFTESQRQFGITADQWQKDFDQGIIRFNTQTQQWERSFALSADQWNKNFDEARRQAGISEDQWNKSFQESQRQFGISADQWQQEFTEGKIRFNVQTQQWERTFAETSKQWQQQFDEARRQVGVSEDQWRQSFDEARRQAGVSEEQWNKNFEQGQLVFDTQTQQWRNTFEESVRQFNVSQENWQKTFDEQKSQYGDSQKWMQYEQALKTGSDADVLNAYREATGKELDPAAVAMYRGYYRQSQELSLKGQDLANKTAQAALDAMKQNQTGTQLATYLSTHLNAGLSDPAVKNLVQGYWESLGNKGPVPAEWAKQQVDATRDVRVNTQIGKMNYDIDQQVAQGVMTKEQGDLLKGFNNAQLTQFLVKDEKTGQVKFDTEAYLESVNGEGTGTGGTGGTGGTENTNTPFSNAEIGGSYIDGNKVYRKISPTENEELTYDPDNPLSNANMLILKAGEANNPYFQRIVNDQYKIVSGGYDIKTVNTDAAGGTKQALTNYNNRFTQYKNIPFESPVIQKIKADLEAASVGKTTKLTIKKEGNSWNIVKA